MTTAVKQYVAYEGYYRSNLTLVPPMADEFLVYGVPETLERARAWALDGRYLLVQGVAGCAHGFYGMSGCPTEDGGDCLPAVFDHVTMWTPAEFKGGERPFLLNHSYDRDAWSGAEVRAYAKAHGLEAPFGPPMPLPIGDEWYQPDAPENTFRLSIVSGMHLYPLEERIAALLSALPIKWPER